MSIKDFKRFDAYTEAYEVVKTVELVGKDKHRYRIEILKCYSNSNIPYTATVYQEVDIDVTPTWPDESKGWGAGSSIAVWSPITIAHVIRDSAESALAQAMGFLADRAKHGSDED